MDRSIFITGGSGNTGQALLGRLLRDDVFKGAAVTCLCRPGGRRSNLERFPVTVVEGDASDPASLKRAYCGEDTVIHISSPLHAGAILKGCVPSRRLIVISSTGVFSRYRRIARRLRSCELEVEHSGLPYTILRPTMIYGTPLDRNISRLIRLIARSRIVPLPAGGSSVFHPVHVDDLASCIIASLKRDHSIGKTYTVPGGSSHPLKEIVRIISSLIERRVVTVPIPYGVSLAAIRLIGSIRPRFPMNAEQIQRLLEDKSYDYEAARDDLDYSPMPFREGVSRQLREMGFAPSVQP